MDINLWIDGSNVDVGDDLALEVQIINPTEQRMTTVTTIGEVPFSHSDESSLLGEMGYVVLTDGEIKDLEDNFVRRIVGFGLATEVMLVDSQISFTRQLPQPVGAQNASSTVRPPKNEDDSSDWDDLNLSSLFEKTREHADSGSIVLAPALVRTID